MNILLYTFGILIALGMLSFHVMGLHRELELSRQYFFTVSERAFLKKQQENERKAFEKAVQKSAPQTGGGQSGKRQKNIGINMLFLLEEDHSSLTFLQTRQLIIDLWQYLFDPYPLFLDAKHEHPHLYEEILDVLVLKAKELKVKRLDQFEKIDLQNEKLQELWYYMQRYDDGTWTLKDFLCTSRENQGADLKKIWIFYAPRPILSVIFAHSDIADEFIEWRGDLFHAVSSGKKDPEQAAQVVEAHVKDLLQSQNRVEIDLLLDYTVYKTVKPVS